jgi:uncharacterized membrane protein YgdD (TMEM256/DUF423 family)
MLSVAACTGATGVVLGAFGAHALKARLDASQLASWNTAVEYHLLHSLLLVALALYANATGRNVQLPYTLVLAGLCMFSGSIYGLVLAGWRWLGPVTPIGGLLLIGGWLALAWFALKGASDAA